MSNIWEGLGGSPGGTVSASAILFVDANGIQRADPAELGYSNTTNTLFLGGALSAFRITGDFSNGTTTNRVIFQSSITNGGSLITAIPNGTSNVAGFTFFNTSDPANAAFFAFNTNTGSSLIQFGKLGTGTYGPLIINASVGGAGEMARFGEGQTADVYLGGDTATKSLRVVGVTGSSRWLELSGSVANNPKIATSGGSLDLGSAVVFTNQTVASTVGAAGGASALPATPLGYMTTSINGVACKIPYYSV